MTAPSTRRANPTSAPHFSRREGRTQVLPSTSPKEAGAILNPATLWLETRPDRQECPVCKAGISRENVVPLYGRGSQKPQDPRLKTPPRPQGQRPAPETRGGFQPFGDTGGFHFSFGVGAFPFGFFTTVFNAHEPFRRGAGVDLGQGHPASSWQDSLFLFLAIFFFFWLLSI
ncbi:E3 ubiquitin-protein ligase RNF5 [Microtus ochrogaster]|uniref:E3 ubiquitin-protein ligase RNF n=1 Tax=Microtus ochrogaster TaxID=79684 RepID=A0A8J6G9M9_MICOH|nr:E3 ubiquitin-protein ligase RNF5 [Microtus ochrogaster]